MNYLQLCQRVQMLMRISAGAVGQTPTTVASQTGVELEIVTHVNQAYRDIQAKHERHWKFMWGNGTFNTVAGTREYTVSSSITNYNRLVPYMAQDDRPYILQHTNSIGISDQSPVWFTSWPEWQGGILDRGTRSQARPSRYTVKPDGKIEFDPTPDAVYVTTVDYRRTIHEMTTDSDATTGTPIIPSDFHMAIVWRAIKYLCISRPPSDALYQMADREYNIEMRRLENDQLPEIVMDEVWSHP